MDSLFVIIGIFVFIVVFGIFIFTFLLVFNPKVRGKMLSKQVQAARYMLNDVKGDLEEMGNTTINVQKNIIDKNEEALKDISLKEANISKEKVKITARAIKEGLTEDSIYCKYCGSLIDVDSKYCKNCGKEQ